MAEDMPRFSGSRHARKATIDVTFPRGDSMSLDEQAIHFVRSYFEAIAYNALNDASQAVGDDASFAEFMEMLVHKISRLSAEYVAAEVLQLSPRAIGTYNEGAGMDVDDVQDLIDSAGDGEMGLDDE
jgi:hypothetical protein